MLHFICLLFALNLPQDTNWHIFKDTLNRYTIEYPSDWEQTYVEGATGFVSPFANDSDDFRENVNVTIQNLSSNPMTLAQYTETTRQQYTESYGQKALLSIADTTCCGIKATKGVFAITFGDKEIKLEQVWFIRKNMAYIITYTAEPKQFENYKPIAEKVMRSFTLPGDL